MINFGQYFDILSTSAANELKNGLGRGRSFSFSHSFGDFSWGWSCFFSIKLACVAGIEMGKG